MKRLFGYHNPDRSSDTWSKEGFLKFYCKASFDRPTHVIDDIVMQGMGQRLIDLKKLDDDINCKNPNNFQQLLQLRHSFVKYLKNKFLSNEKMLILSMIKNAYMVENKFENMNDDLLNLILKYLHPLYLNEKHLVSADIDIDETIRNHFKYELGLGCVAKIFDREYKLLNQPTFADKAKKYLFDSGDKDAWDILANKMAIDNESNLIGYRNLIHEQKYFKSNQTTD